MNFKEMCRTCLRSGEMMSSLFDGKIVPENHTAADLLAMFTSVQVDKEDDFPHNICDICLKEIQQAYLFDLKCRKSEIILLQLREIRVNLKKLKVIPKQNNIVSEVAGELESILKEAKLEDVMNLCDRNTSNSESSASERIGSAEEENVNTSEKLKLQIVEEEYTRDFQLAFKREPHHSTNLMKDDTKEKEVECTHIVSNLQIVEENCDSKTTLKKEPDHTSLIIRNNAAQNELELNQNSSNFVIFDEYVSEYEVSIKTEPYQNNFIVKDNKKEEKLEFSEISSNFQAVEEECVQDFHVTIKSEPELDIGIDCLDCLKQFQSLDTFRGHIVSDHLEENVCKLCNEEFECSQFEHSAKHLPSSEPENPSGSSEKSITQEVQMKAIQKDEFVDKPDRQCKICSKVFVNRYRLVNHMRTHTGGKPFDCELLPENSENSSSSTRTKPTSGLITDDKPVSDLQCTVCYEVFPVKWRLRNHMLTHTGEKPFQCKLCPAKYRLSNTLLYHRRTKHKDELISNDKPVSDFQCSVCSKVYSQKYQLKNHMRVHTGEKPFQCKLCPEKFRRSETLLCHGRTKHTDELISDVSDFQCSVCNKVFGQKCHLRNHMRVHTGEKPFECEFCPEKFQRSHALLGHRRSKHRDELITDDKPVPDLQCSVCYKIFGYKSLLRDHMRVHTGEKPFQCKLCPEKFQRSHALLGHRRTKHPDEFISDDKPVPDFQCSVCYKVFAMKGILRKHMLNHTGEKPFDCELCPEKFRDRPELLCHRRTKHADELISDDKQVVDLQCSVCHKVFRCNSLLRNHMLLHTGEKPFQCKLCPAKFRRSVGLLWHRRTQHPDQLISDVQDLQCSVCYKIFGQKHLLKNHMLVHTGEKPFQCELCPDKFRTSKSLLSHTRTKHTDKLISDDKPVPDFQCTVCSKIFGLKFRLKNHMRVHTGEKPFQCKLCPEKFQRGDVLKIHVQTKHSDERPEFKCKVCSKVFLFKHSLNKHMRVNTHIID